MSNDSPTEPTDDKLPDAERANAEVPTDESAAQSNSDAPIGPEDIVLTCNPVKGDGRFLVVAYLGEKQLNRDEFRLNREPQRAKFIAKTIEAIPNPREGDKAFRDHLDEQLKRFAAVPPGDVSPPSQESEPEDCRRQIILTAHEADVTRQVVEALAVGDPTIYQRGGELVTTFVQPGPKPTRPIIKALSAAAIRTRITDVAALSEQGFNGAPIPAHPPTWLPPAVKDLTFYKGIRPLGGIATAPVLRADGSVQQEPGYDAATGLLYIPTCNFDPIPSSPTLEDAKRAIEVLKLGVSEFPFQESSDRSGWLAEVLTLCVRHAIDGPSMGFYHTANIPASGKTVLINASAYIATGFEAPCEAYPVAGKKNDIAEDIAEVRKLATSCAAEGHAAMLLDNVPTGFAFGSPTMDAILTSRVNAGRDLGFTSAPVREISTVWFWSGNNITPVGDTNRRVVAVRLYSEEEDPGERPYKLNVFKWAEQNRPSLFVAAVTVVAAYIRAGKPSVGLKPIASFEAWSDLVRSALVWIGETDPCAARGDVAADDPDRETAWGLIGLLEVCGATVNREAQEKDGMTAKEIVEAIEKELRHSCPFGEKQTGWLLTSVPTGQHPLLDAYRKIFPHAERPNSATLGNLLKKHKGRKIDGKRIERSGLNREKVAMWVVEIAGSEDAVRGNENAPPARTPRGGNADNRSGSEEVRGVRGQNYNTQPHMCATTERTHVETRTRFSRTCTAGAQESAPASPASPAPPHEMGEGSLFAGCGDSSESGESTGNDPLASEAF